MSEVPVLNPSVWNGLFYFACGDAGHSFLSETVEVTVQH